VARPAEDALANKLRRRLPLKLAYMLTRWKNVLLGMYFYQLCKRKPEKVKSLILGGVRQMLGPDYDVATHFTPKYNPWDQRLCLVPDADLFRAIRKKKASVVTDQIETFTEKGIKLKSGAELEADVVVTATGLVVQSLGGAKLVVDGKPVKPSDTMIYKGMMYSDVPNLASIFGYTNASWTLKADLVCEYVCRLLNHMDRKGFTKAVPHNSDPTLTEEPWVNFSSGYIQRALPHQPKQGSKRPWKLYQNYVLDLLTLRHGSLRDKAMVFSK
jgi:cation diffusion facilitator CzcD-associated flavoprotein CzcO